MNIFVPVLHSHFHCSVDIHILYGWHQKEIALKEDCILIKSSTLKTVGSTCQLSAISFLVSLCILSFTIDLDIYSSFSRQVDKCNLIC